ncbi:hypothetical protein [Amycolatopsis sacchari]|uniref:hypothetical protein n=1 Tax=Amycolatopsis sacchari TaxID=115433 RepID=UPI003D72D34B
MTEPSPARRRAAEKIFAHEERLAAQRYEREVRPGFRERAEELMRGEWGEPVAALRLGDTSLGFEVPGRRLDGTTKGRKLVRRFFWNILRGVGRLRAGQRRWQWRRTMGQPVRAGESASRARRTRSPSPTRSGR